MYIEPPPVMMVLGVGMIPLAAMALTEAECVKDVFLDAGEKKLAMGSFNPVPGIACAAGSPADLTEVTASQKVRRMYSNRSA
jgi:hypothetical protein